MDTCCSVQEKRRHIPCETAKERPYATSLRLIKAQLKFPCVDGQSSEFLQGRTATVPGRSLRGLSKSVELLATLRYVTHHLFSSLCNALQHQIILDNEPRLAEVYFFIHMRHNGEELGLALVELTLFKPGCRSPPRLT